MSSSLIFFVSPVPLPHGVCVGGVDVLLYYLFPPWNIKCLSNVFKQCLGNVQAMFRQCLTMFRRRQIFRGCGGLQRCKWDFSPEATQQPTTKTQLQRSYNHKLWFTTNQQPQRVTINSRLWSIIIYAIGVTLLICLLFCSGSLKYVRHDFVNN